MRTNIAKVIAREILDSRGYPTVEAEVQLEGGAWGRMQVPSGASTGKYEAWELRDGDRSRYQGKGVLKAVFNVNGEIARALTGVDALDQEKVDNLLIQLDGTPNKARLGANAILAVSLAVCRAVTQHANQPLYRYLAEKYLPDPQKLAVPMPMVNIISGGLHAGKNVDIQDFLIIPVRAKNCSQALETVSNVYWEVKRLLIEKGYTAHLLADEGGFGPQLQSNEEALALLCQAMERLDYAPGEDVAIAMDVASSHFYDSANGEYDFQSEGRRLDSSGMIELFRSWTDKYPIISIEDGLAEDDWEGWTKMTEALGESVQLIGDDLFTTNVERIKQGIRRKAGNSVLIKMNQIGTLTETVRAVNMAQAAGFTTVISARSGETEDSTLADLAVGLNGGQIKIGSLAGSSRLSKYNQLLRIQEDVPGFAEMKRFGGTRGRKSP